MRFVVTEWHWRRALLWLPLLLLVCNSRSGELTSRSVYFNRAVSPLLKAIVHVSLSK